MPFEGQLVPFGARVRFILSTTSKAWENRLKFSEEAIYVVFMGYKIAVGGTWRGQYIVAPLEEFDAENVLRGALNDKTQIFPQYVSNIIVEPGDWVFPCGKGTCAPMVPSEAWRKLS